MGKRLENLGYWTSTITCAIMIVMVLPAFVKTLLHDAWGMIVTCKWDWTKSGNFVGYFIGLAIYAVCSLRLIVPRSRHNLNWFMKFTHELTHTLVAVLFFAKIREFVVKDRTCYVNYKSGPIGYVPITLAPYCIPIYTFMILPFRFFGKSHYMIAFDILIALTYAFHVHSFIKQTRRNQPDIEGCGLARSAMFISLVHMLVLSVLFATPKGGVANAIERVFWDYSVQFYTLPHQWLADVLKFL